ncbi:hypothetical protein X747_14965 [Mesorhizobium sp. LNJC384A00]|uniref:hypothetical protein n=1 Tax=unclassified Mesorhizobium TaxID=325217 RepID=UPI0003CEA9EF|nr:hypothetical protein [Mesorhizobium sp. LNJC384A00]ESY42066.1 hypothetical protein X747_14965 [Mesorhizobium sp. LNJC384A00]
MSTPDRSILVSALQAELNRQYDLGIMTTFIDADGKTMLSYPVVYPAPRPLIDVGRLADTVLASLSSGRAR